MTVVEMNTTLPVLRAIAVKGFVDTEPLLDRVGGKKSALEQLLRQLAEGELVVRRDGRLCGWALTADGKRVVGEQLAVVRARENWDEWLEPSYDHFVELNEPMKALCTAWQLEGQPTRCVGELREFHARLRPTLGRLGGRLPWFDHYLGQFESALDRLTAGDMDAFTRPLANSYHDIWMELHQDLLLSLGRTRSAADGH